MPPDVALAEAPVVDQAKVDRVLAAPDIDKLESRMLSLPQIQIPLTHAFAPGVYLREVVMPKGSFIVGHRHKTEHFNLVLTGRASVLMDGVVHQIQAPAIFVSAPGVRKVLYIHEDMRWATVHPTQETDLERLAEELIIKTEGFKAHELEQLRQHLAGGSERVASTEGGV